MKNLHLTVAAIIEDQGRFLFVEEHSGGKLVINQPAGHVEAGETLPYAVSRETLEETAWRFTPESLVGIYLWQHPLNDEYFLRAAFTGSHYALDPALALDTGIERTLWLTPAELQKRHQQLRSPMVMRGIEDYLAGSRYDLNMLKHINNEELIVKAAKIAN